MIFEAYIDILHRMDIDIFHTNQIFFLFWVLLSTLFYYLSFS